MANNSNTNLEAELRARLADDGAPRQSANGTYMPSNADKSLTAKMLDASVKQAENSNKNPTSELERAFNYGIPDSQGNLGILAQQLDTVDPYASIFNYNRNNFLADRAQAQAIAAGYDDLPSTEATLPAATSAPVAATETAPVTPITPNTSTIPTNAPQSETLGGFEGVVRPVAQDLAKNASDEERRNTRWQRFKGALSSIFSPTPESKLFNDLNNTGVTPDGTPYKLITGGRTVNVDPNSDEGKAILNQFKQPLSELQKATDASVNGPIGTIKSTANINTNSAATTSADDSQLQLANPNHYSNKVNTDEKAWATRQNTVESRLQEAFNSGSDYDLSSKDKDKTTADAIEKKLIGSSGSDDDPLSNGQRWGAIQLVRDHIANNEAISTNTLTKLGNDMKAITNDTMSALSNRVSNLGSIKDTVYALENANASAEDVIAKYYPKLDPLDDNALGIASLIEEGKNKHSGLSYAVIGTALKKHLTNSTLSKMFGTTAIAKENLEAMKGKFFDTLAKLDSNEEGNIHDIEDTIYRTIQKLQDLQSLKTAYDTASTSINQAIADQASFTRGNAPKSQFAEEILRGSKIQAFNDSYALYAACLPVFTELDAYNNTSKNNKKSSKTDDKSLGKKK